MTKANPNTSKKEEKKKPKANPNPNKKKEKKMTETSPCLNKNEKQKLKNNETKLLKQNEQLEKFIYNNEILRKENEKKLINEIEKLKNQISETKMKYKEKLKNLKDNKISINRSEEDLIKSYEEKLKEKEKEVAKFKKIALDNKNSYIKLKEGYKKLLKERNFYMEEIEKKKICINNLQDELIENVEKVSNLSEVNFNLIKEHEDSIRSINELNNEIIVLKDELENFKNNNNNNNNNNDSNSNNNNNNNNNNGYFFSNSTINEDTTENEENIKLKKEIDFFKDDMKEFNNIINFAETNLNQFTLETLIKKFKNKWAIIQNRLSKKCALTHINLCEHNNNEFYRNDEDSFLTEQLKCGCYFHRDCLDTAITIFKSSNNMDEIDNSEILRNYCPICDS